MQVTKDTKIFETLELDEGTAGIFIAHGMHCLGCPGARGETIERAARAHGIDGEALLKDLNDYLATKE